MYFPELREHPCQNVRQGYIAKLCKALVALSMSTKGSRQCRRIPFFCCFLHSTLPIHLIHEFQHTAQHSRVRRKPEQTARSRYIFFFFPWRLEQASLCVVLFACSLEKKNIQHATLTFEQQLWSSERVLSQWNTVVELKPSSFRCVDVEFIFFVEWETSTL